MVSNSAGPLGIGMSGPYKDGMGIEDQLKKVKTPGLSALALSAL